MSDLPAGIDLSVTHSVRPHVAVKRLRRQLRERRKNAGDRGPEGRPLCLWCLKEVPPHCSVWCSVTCTETFYGLTDWNTIKRLVGERDHGICVNCKLDTIGLEREYHDIYIRQYDRDSRAQATKDLAAFKTRMVSRGFLESEIRFTLFQVDHIVPLAEGGSNELDNLRTLCIPCHKIETKAMHRRLADARRSRVPLIPSTSVTSPEGLR